MISASETAFRLKLLLQQHTVTLTGMLLTERQTSPALARMRKLAQPPSRPGQLPLLTRDVPIACSPMMRWRSSAALAVPRFLRPVLMILDQGHRRRWPPIQDHR